MKKIFACVITLCACTALYAQNRGGDLETGAITDARNAPVQGKQWAVFIAIDEYREWGPLLYPVKDAKEIKNILQEYYFIDEVKELYNKEATAASIRRLFVDLQNKTGPHDSVFIFHAGHGTNEDKTKTPAWIPYDGGSDVYAQANWLPHVQIRSMVDSLRAKHVFLISDSCFSGDLLDAQRGAAGAITNYPAAYDKVSRQAMSSGASEEVNDVSEFASRLKNILMRTETPYITPDYLLSQVKEAHTARPLYTIPILAVIPRSSHELGASFLFFRKNPQPNVLVQPTPPAAPPQRPVPADFVRVEGGTFQMGGTAKDNEKPVHTVTVKSFNIGKYEVTQKEWYEVMGTTIRQQRDMADKSWPMRGEGDNYPMYYVSWNEAVEYCVKRSLKEGLTPAYRGSGNNITCDWNANGYRLPTEAEWEFAAKGGIKDYLTTEYSGSNSVGAVAWYNGNSGESTHPVGTKAANSLGIHDMSGNVWEWCWDWYGNYGSGAQTDPRGPSSGAYRVIRGGSWIDPAGDVRSAYRYDIYPFYRYYSFGFRLVRP